jgi:hypothetical protein
MPEAKEDGRSREEPAAPPYFFVSGKALAAGLLVHITRATPVASAIPLTGICSPSLYS